MNPPSLHPPFTSTTSFLHLYLQTYLHLLSSTYFLHLYLHIYLHLLPPPPSSYVWQRVGLRNPSEAASLGTHKYDFTWRRSIAITTPLFPRHQFDP